MISTDLQVPDDSAGLYDGNLILDEAGLSQAILQSDIGQRFTTTNADTSISIWIQDDALLSNIAAPQNPMVEDVNTDVFESWLAPCDVSASSVNPYDPSFGFDIEQYLRVSPTSDTMLSTRGELGSLKPHRAANLFAERNAGIVLQSLRTFPTKMINRDDPPFFIHGYKDRPMPEPLLVCSRICHMFDTRTPDILPFLWRCIRSEEERFLHDVRVC